VTFSIKIDFFTQ